MGTLGMLSAIMLLSSKIGVVPKLSNSYSEKSMSELIQKNVIAAGKKFFEGIH